MPELTDNKMGEALRFRANKEASARSKTNEDLIQEIADYTMATSQEFDNEQLRSMFSDIANEMMTNKSVLATGGGATPPDAVGGVAPPPIPPGMGPEGPVVPQGLPIQ